MCKAIEYSNKVLKVYDEISKDFSILCDEQSKTDLMIQDILHTIENTNFNASEGYKYAKQLKDIRNGRRDIKNEHETLTILVQELKPVADKLRKINGTIAKLNEKQKTRIYIPRIIK